MTMTGRARNLAYLHKEDPPRVDIERLQKVWAHIQDSVAAELVDERQDEVLRQMSRSGRVDGWDQATWRAGRMYPGNRCRTAMCLAGWTAHLDAVERGTGGWLISDAWLETVARMNEADEFGDLPLTKFGDLSLTKVPDLDERADLYLAGFGAHLMEPTNDDPSYEVQDLSTDPEYVPNEYAKSVRGVSASDRARRLLGLTEHEASRLFEPSNTLTRLGTIIGELVLQEKVRRARRDELAALVAADTQEENG